MIGLEIVRPAIHFQKKSDRSCELLELIYSDVCGPVRVESNDKAKYFVTFVDDLSRWCEVRFLKMKADVYDFTRDYIAFTATMVENMSIPILTNI